MRRSVRIWLLLLAACSVLTLPVLADSGPKPQLTVRVENAPAEPYALDLLEQDQPGQSLCDNTAAARDADPALTQALLAAVPAGWHACLLQGSHGPLWGSLTAGADGAHTFGYFGLPQTYRVAIAVRTGETWVSGPLERHALQSSLTVDWAAGTVSSPPVWRACALELLATLLPTLLIEGGVLLAFGYTLRRSWRPFLLANLATQLGLYLFLGLRVVRQGWSGWYLFLFVPAEAVIALAEVLFYRRFLTEQSRRRAAAYALAANLLSALAGWFLAEPVWRWIVRLS
jgi:hypothetical protein